MTLKYSAPSHSILRSILRPHLVNVSSSIRSAIPVNPFVNREHKFLLPKPQPPAYLAVLSFVQLLCSSPQLLLRGLWRHICIALVSNRCELLLPKGRTIHAQRDLRALRLKVLRGGLQAVPGGVLILVGLVVAGGGFGGR